MTNYVPGTNTVVRALSGSSTNLDFPSDVAFDATGNMWVTNYNNSTLDEFNPPSITSITSTNSNVAPFRSTIVGLLYPFEIAFDAKDALWIANGGNNSVSAYDIATGANSGSVSGSNTNLNVPSGIAFDGSGNLCVSNVGSNALTAYAAPSATTRSANSSQAATISGSSTMLSGPLNLAFDASGNLWVTNLSGGVNEYPHSSLLTTENLAPARRITAGTSGPTGLVFTP